MGTAYFILKNTVLTFVIVSLLQIEVGSKTLETYLMRFVRSSLAPKFLGQEPIEIDGSMNFSKEQLNSIKDKIRQSEFYKEAKSSVRETMIEEIQSIYQESLQKPQEKTEEDEEES
jgi:hypothetical protein